MAKKKGLFRNRSTAIQIALFVLAVCGPLIASHAAAQATDQKIIIATGGVGGVYYPAGVAICAAINKKVRGDVLSCSAKSTGGSVFNVNSIRSGDFNFGVVQSDVQYFAVKGFGPFKAKGPDTKLRSVFSLHSELFTILARTDAGIKTFDDLKGKRVNIGNPGSGQRTSMELVMHAKGWTKDVFASSMELPSAVQAKALCDNKVDAIIFMAGHPNASIKEATTSCNTVLVEVAGPAIANLIKKYPYYSAEIIPGGMYKGTPHRIRTFGVNATVVTSADTPDDLVHDLVQYVFEDLIDIKFSHPAFFALNTDDMVSKGLVAPLHPGAMRYFKRAGDLSRHLKVRAPSRR